MHAERFPQKRVNHALEQNLAASLTREDPVSVQGKQQTHAIQ